MIHHDLDPGTGILRIAPEGKLQSSDFEQLAASVDAYIEQKGGLNGLMICTESFPGWEDFAALVSHLRFVKGHHKQIKKVAAVTDSKVLSIAPRIVDHFVAAEFKHFDYGDRQAALDWLGA